MPTPTLTPTTVDDYLAAAARLDVPRDAYIDGAFVPARSGRRFPAVSPRDGSVLAEVAECDAEDMDLPCAPRGPRSTTAAGRTARRDRRRVLLRLASLISERREELALLESLDMGKPVAMPCAVDIRVDDRDVRVLRRSGRQGLRRGRPDAARHLATITREPSASSPPSCRGTSR